MELEFWWLILLLVFFAFGWVTARIDLKQLLNEAKTLPAEYFKGLNYLITNQHDKAIESFSEAAQDNADSFELNFALGSLLRRRGEIDRAIHLHKALLSNPDLVSQQRLAVTAELAQDYLKAGLFDRAEALFESLEDERYRQPSLRALLEIYVREREWERAIKAANELEQLSGVSFRTEVANYYCELAMNAKLSENLEEAKALLNQALAESKACVRANVLLGDIAFDTQEYGLAITYWKHIEFQNPEYLTLVAAKMLRAYQAQNQIETGLQLINHYHSTYHLAPIQTVLFESTLTENGPKDAAIMARQSLIKEPSLHTIDQLLQAKILLDEQQTTEDALQEDHQADRQLMQQAIHHAIDQKLTYACSQCGFKAKYHHWQCPACNAWESLETEAMQ